MKFDKLIVGGTIVTAFGRYPGAIGIKDGKIACIAETACGLDADEVINATGKFVLPGAIDGHLHYQAPINPEAEDVEHATRAAAVGGITTGIAMPVEWATSVEGYHDLQEYFNGKAYIDYGFHGHADAKIDNLDKIEALWTETEINGLKTFTTYDVMVDNGQLWHILETSARVNGLTMVHCEDDALIKMYEKRLKEEGRNDILAHVDSRPTPVEVQSVRNLISLTEMTGGNTLVVHCSTAQAIEEIMDARRKGVKIWAECCPHYFTFVREDIEKYGPYLAFTPVMRDEANRIRLWELLDKGYIQTIGSDHCPTTRENKDKSKDSVWGVFCGLAGLEAHMAVLLDGANKGYVSLERIVQATSYNPARMYGIYPQKGSLRVGADADLIVVDMDKEQALTEADLKVKCGWSPYCGISLKGWPVVTVVRGEVVAKAGEIVGEQGFGKQAKRLRPFDVKPEFIS